ncbi:50S ribosomal protein L22 [Mycoplasma haemocanis str. Illinois]|uniref:Large ribosomal subunit protein uL22 n=1 Tax=Mycoplasma haemocanis (strain Illinois) TaxID=1111676 RepID=H6N8G1_MYCHN|nr:50S ribosomal protein L22 [Mycoplasma haemocanis]AEW45933.1 50S ribosomal protein L22 [Mycoplasma haemocanis str. Illinois]
MIARAIQRNVHVSSKKAVLCCRLIRNKSYMEAIRILDNQPQKTAKFLKKLLMSAAANAVNNHAMSGDKLYVFSSSANQGRTLKRTIPRAKGRADLIRKRFSHLEICLSDDKDERKKLNVYLLKPRAHQHKYKPKLVDRSVEIKPKSIMQNESDGSKG